MKAIPPRDLKPANMVGPFGEVQVMDLGLAKRIHAAGRGDTVSDEVKPGQVDH
jgi:hypothetical protein